MDTFAGRRGQREVRNGAAGAQARPGVDEVEEALGQIPKRALVRGVQSACPGENLVKDLSPLAFG